MKVSDLVTYKAQGPRSTMLDLASRNVSNDKYEYLTVVDGNGRDGLVVAQLAMHVIGEMTANESMHDQRALDRAIALSERISRLTDEIAHLAGGAVFTTVIVPPDKDTELAVVHLGDVEAFRVRDHGRPEPLTTPHTYGEIVEGLWEPAGQYEVVERNGRTYFRDPTDEASQPTETFGAIGYPNARYMVHKPTVATCTLTQPGIIAIGSDGLWGGMDYPDIQNFISVNPTQEAVDQLAIASRDNATLLMATLALQA